MIPTDVLTAFGFAPDAHQLPFAEAGNINTNAVRVVTDTHDEWLFQKLNTSVFPLPERVMSNAFQWHWASNTLALVNPELGWRNIGFAVTEQEHGLVDGWRAIRLMPDVTNYRSLQSAPENAAFELGRGLAVSRAIGRMLVADEIPPSLPGYRDSELYWRQYQAVVSGDPTPFLPTDPEVLKATKPHFSRAETAEVIEARLSSTHGRHLSQLLKSHLDLAREIPNRVASGDLDCTVIHGDTKLDNFLFDRRTGAICALIDLDTVMPHSWLVDFGDTIRSVANPAGEVPARLEDVTFDLKSYKATVEGFQDLEPDLSSAEQEAMTIAPLALAWEQCLRFYTDWIRGNTYYQAPDNELNLYRALAQARLLENMAVARDAGELGTFG